MGFPRVSPTEYAAWWEETLRQTKIDVVMLQDSGAEHLGFFTLADREPFFAAMQTACRAAGIPAGAGSYTSMASSSNARTISPG